jgi:redox-sensitive bicupin YhaK (pirin superfamily)
MLTIRRAGDRGHTDLGWLQSHHTFSFGGYHDVNHMQFHSLRVLNDDVIAPGRGFGAHGHRDAEIVSYVLSGSLSHRDTTASGHRVKANELQAMTAGTGVIHSEFNASPVDPVHFLQIWILPAREDLEPSCQHVSYDATEKKGRLRPMAGPVGRVGAGAAGINQDAWMFASVLEPNSVLACDLSAGRHAWVHCATGAIEVNGVHLEAGDGLAISDEHRLAIGGRARVPSELLLFDLP